MDEDSDYVPYVDSSLYVWPPACSDSKDACYCHITDYTVYDENNMSVDLLACGADFHWDLGATFRVIATLVPPAGSSKKEKKTQFSVLNYAIDFGYDNDRGFWLCDKYDVWYKLEDPNELYKPYAAGALRFASEFIKLMDALLKPDRHGITHSVQIGERYSCNKSLEYMYQISDHAFDIDVLAEYDPLLCKRLETLFVTGCTLMAQFQPLGNNPMISTGSKKKGNKKSASWEVQSDSIKIRNNGAGAILTGTTSGVTGSEGMLLSVVGEGSEDDLFDRDFDPDLHIESRDDLNSVPLNNLEFLNENVITPARATVSEPRMEKRPRLGPDWVRGIERSSQTLTIDDINCKLANAPDADDSVLSKLKSVAIKKRPQRSVSTLAITGEASAVVGLKHPNPGQILKAKVSYVESFGLFMQLPSPYGTGFVHNSQVSFNKDFNVKKMININQEFYVKVIKVFNSKQRNGSNDKVNVDLSIKYCEQLGGSDLDKDWEKYDKECGTKGDIKSVVRHDGRSAVSDFTTKSQSINSSSSFFPTARTEPTPLNDDYLHEVSSSNNRSNVASLAPAKLPNSNLLLPKSSTFSALSRLVSANRVKKGAGDNAPSSEFVRSAINIDNGVSGIANAAKNVLLKQDKIDVRPISTPSGSSLTPAQIHSNVLLPKSSTFSALSRLISANRVKKGAGDNKSSSDSIVAHNAVGTPSGFVNGSTTVSTSGAKSQPLLVAPSFISEVTTAGNYSREKLESNSLPRSQAEPSATMKNFILSRQAQKIASNVTAGDKSFNREDASSSDANKISTANSKCAEDFLNNISKSNFGMPPEVIHAVPSKRSHFQDPHPIIGSDRINPGNRGWKENDYISAEEGEIQDVFKSKSRDGRLPHEDQNSVALNKKMAACKHKMKKQKIVDSRKDDGTYKAGMYGPGGDRNDDTSTYRPEKYLH